jgi:FtsP/CotA-like multicopper oxidase with cupredoxin domain
MCYHRYIDDDGDPVEPAGTGAGGSWVPFIPGPVIRADKDDTVVVTIQNRIDVSSNNFVEELGEQTTVHWHGIELSNPHDGTPVTQFPIGKNADFTYRYKVPRTGVFWYHPHWNSVIQTVLGSYGTLVIENDTTNELRTNKVIPTKERTFVLTLSDVSFQSVRTEAEGTNHVPLASFPTTDTVYIRDIMNLQPNPGGAAEQNFGDVIVVNGRHGVPFNAAASNFQQLWDGGNRQTAGPVTVNEGESLAFYLANTGLHRFYKVKLVFSTDDPTTDPDAVSWTVSDALFRIGGEAGLLNEARAGGGVFNEFRVVGRKGREGAGTQVVQPSSELVAGEFLIPASSRTMVAFAIEAGWNWVGLQVNGFSVQNSGPVTTDEDPSDLLIARFAVSTTVDDTHKLTAPIEEGTPLRLHGSLIATDPMDDLRSVGSPVKAFSGCSKEVLEANGVPVPSGALTLAYDVSLNQAGGPAIDGEQVMWNADGPTQPTGNNTRYLQLGDVVEWTVETQTAGADHPWHIHGYSFQPVKMELRTGTNPDGTGIYQNLYDWGYVEWLDSVYVPSFHRLTYRFRVDDHTHVRPDLTEEPFGALGRWLSHCHIFKHAHLGMMMNFIVVDGCDLTPKSCELTTDRSHFSQQEVEAESPGTVASTFPASFFVVLNGYRPEQLGIDDPSPGPTDLASWAPTPTFEDGGTPIAGMVGTPTAMYLEVPDTTVRQRITFEYSLTFDDTSMFPTDVNATRNVLVRAMVDGHACTGAMVLFHKSNPYMLDGETHWLSTDLRVFQIQPEGEQSGIEFLDTETPAQYLAKFLAQVDGTADSLTHPFREIETNQQLSGLEMATSVGGAPVYNFAIARVRYRNLLDATTDVRVFFRLFTTAVTNMAYQTETYPRDEPTLLPEFGVSLDEVLTVPCFSVPRSQLATDGDIENVKPLGPDPTGDETLAYFGAILDINQDELVFVDPADGDNKSVRELIRNRHQCLVAEVHYGDDPIPTGATPANNENLSQRNLLIVDSDNPGAAPGHVVTHTFDLQTTAHLRDDNFTHVRETMMAVDGPADKRRAQPLDELWITWGGLPPESDATLFMPTLLADDILAVANQRPGPPKLEKVDAHTIRCKIGDISFVPLPAPTPRRIAGLLRIQLPLTVVDGDYYTVMVRQHAARLNRIVGEFQVSVVIGTNEGLLAPEMRWLNVLRIIGAKMKPDNRWFAILERYLHITEDRVRAFGADPARIPPAGQEHTWGEQEPPSGEPDSPSDGEAGPEATPPWWTRPGKLCLVLFALLALAILLKLACGCKPRCPGRCRRCG